MLNLTVSGSFQLQSSSTQSAASSDGNGRTGAEGGAPTKDVGDLTDSGRDGDDW